MNDFNEMFTSYHYESFRCYLTKKYLNISPSLVLICIILVLYITQVISDPVISFSSFCRWICEDYYSGICKDLFCHALHSNKRHAWLVLNTDRSYNHLPDDVSSCLERQYSNANVDYVDVKIYDK